MLVNVAPGIGRMLFVLVWCSFDAVAADSDGMMPSASAQSTTAAAGNLNSGYLVQLIIGLLFVLLCIVALAWLAKRVNRFQASSDGSLQVLGGLSMGARERVVLVQVGSTQLLLGVAPGRVNMLHQLDQPLVQADADSHHRSGMPVARGFAEKLNAALSRYK